MSQGLDMEFKHILFLAEVDFVCELLVADAFSASSTFSLVSHNGCHVLNVEDTHWAEAFELNCIVSFDWFFDSDVWQ